MFVCVELTVALLTQSGMLLGVMLIWLDLFFFKQKTAYELRISDWSSDVCSSDLAGSLLSRTRVGRRPSARASDDGGLFSSLGRTSCAGRAAGDRKSVV